MFVWLIKVIHMLNILNYLLGELHTLRIHTQNASYFSMCFTWGFWLIYLRNHNYTGSLVPKPQDLKTGFFKKIPVLLQIFLGEWNDLIDSTTCLDFMLFSSLMNDNCYKLHAQNRLIIVQPLLNSHPRGNG